MSRLKRQLKKLRTIQDRQEVRETQDGSDGARSSLINRRLEQIARRRSGKREDGDEADD